MAKANESPKALTAVIHLPDVRLHFYLSFQYDAANPPVGTDAKMMGRILDKASNLPTEVQELLVTFAEHILKTEKEQSPNKN